MQESVYPTTGKVIFRGKPLAQARVVFHRIVNRMDGSNPSAVTDADGNFQVSTRRLNDGAPEGELSVTVSFAPIKNPGASDPEFGPEQLPAKYQNPEKSGLKVTIKPGQNKLEPFEIK